MGHVKVPCPVCGNDMTFSITGHINGRYRCPRCKSYMSLIIDDGHILQNLVRFDGRYTS